MANQVIHNPIATLNENLATLNENLSNAIKCIKMNIPLNATGEWTAWPANIGYGGYQLIKAFTTTWNAITVFNENSGYWHIKAEGLTDSNIDMFLIIVYAPMPI